jgi:ATP/maltotriose-dependent transcriptional regulator MalT
VGDKQGIAFALNNLGTQALHQGDGERAKALLEESLALYRELGDHWGIAMVLHILGDVARYQGDDERARAFLEECLSVWEELGDKRSRAATLNILGQVACGQGDFVRAAALHRESLTLSRALGEQLCLAQSLEGLASVGAAQGEFVWAVLLWGAAEVLREAINAPLPPSDRTAYERAVATARVSLGDQVFAAAWAEGRTMTAEQALAAQGRAVIPTAPPIPPVPAPAPAPKSPVTYPAGLTEREVEVLRLLAQGWTDAQIAEQLVISLRTVNHHTTSLYSKLGVSSRAAATRSAIEHHLL